MPSPFPGMDPYLERHAIWPDFHDSLIVAIRGALQHLLKPRYAAIGRDRLYVLESERPLYPDVAVVRADQPLPGTKVTAAVLEPDAPQIFDLWEEEIREPFLEIIEPAANNRIVTAIEILSPDNKRKGPGRTSYTKKREKYRKAGANLVEIDFLRAGEPTVRLSAAKLKRLRPGRYLVVVTRYEPSRQEIYSIPLQHRLPCIAIPLGPEDVDVPLDLQAAFTRSWEEGPYPAVSRYDGAPPGALTAEELLWCDSLLRSAGFRTAPPESVGK